ncbi:MAG: hybrid sensor histidine kinase/response regulator [Ignavibacteriales bacterium]|nr:MAG: hybrid sensor histidine kinase/response regulator [Ignavibacteriales bacterium]
MFNRNLIIHLKYYLIIFFLFYSADFSAQNIPFKHLTTDDGLSNNKISDIIQDKTGFIWLATDDGLNRFDGYSFKVYRHKPNDNTSISNNSVWTLFEDRAGFIWIGTKSGVLNRYDPNTDRFTSWEIKSEFVKENSITSIYEDISGAIWVGTYKSGLYRYDPATEEIENWRNDPLNKSSLSNNYVTSIVEDADGNLLIGTYIGLNKFNYQKSKNNFIHFFYDVHNPNTLSNNLTWSLSKSKNDPNLIWIGTADGLTSYRSDTKSFSRIPISNPQKLQFGTAAASVIEEIISDEKILWTNSYSGLVRINYSTGQSFRYLSEKNSSDQLISNQINKIIRDRSGVTWIATENGLSYFSSKSTKFNKVLSNKYGLLDFSELRDKNVTAITQTNNGTIWFGTDEGLFRSVYSDGKTLLKRYPKLDGIHIWSLTPTEADNLWIGTYGSGLIFLDVKNNQIKKWQFNDRRLQTQSVLFNKCVLNDDKNNLWIGFWGLGLAKINNVTQDFKLWQSTVKNSESGISHNDVWAIYMDSENRIWVGTNGGGLNLLVDEANSEFVKWLADENQPNSISGNSIYSIIESKTGKHNTKSNQTILWIGTNKGLNKFVINNSANASEKSRFNVEIIKYSIKDGLADNSVNGILEDADGNLWLGTNSGISLFEVTKNKFTNFTKSDGIIGSNFNTTSAFRTQNGLLFFGSSSGLNYFDPKQIIPSSYFAPLVLTDFQIFNQSINAGEKSPLTKNISIAKEVILSYNQNVFSFEFAALDYNSPQSIQYAYMMEGFDEDWIESRSRRFVTYTNLSSGTYKFKVKATNADGIWNENATELAVIINSPWWATGWAYALYVLVIIAGLYTIRRFELNRTRLKNILRMQEYEAIKQKEIDETKSRFFANLSHEFRTPLMLIKGPLEQLIGDESNKKNIDRYKMIHRNTENLQSLIDQLLELTQLESASIPVKAAKEDLISVLRGLLSSFESLADDKKIKLTFNSKNDLLPAWIDKDKLEKIIYNLLSNAFKFTPVSGSISVNVNTVAIDEKNYAEIRISDTGIGIPPQKLDKIFDRFYQVDDSNQRSFGGSGIGLALVKELIDLHKWNITVASEINKGTEFTIHIPLHDDYLNEDQKVRSDLRIDVEKTKIISESIEEDDSEKLSEEILDITRPSILIVEDSKDVRLYLTDLLNQEYILYEASNGKEGIIIAREKIPDLIISDVMMPEMDGMEFCRRIKTDWITSHIPVIMLTAKASGESKIQGLETGADDYLTKPFNSKELFVRVKNLLEQRRLLREKFSKEENKKPETVTANPLDEEFIQKAFSLAEKNLDNLNFDTEAFAKEMFLSRMQFHRKLQAITGQTPGDFVRSFRLKKAAQMLNENRLSVTQIAFAVGYNSPSQFTRAFSKQFNCTPTEYLNKSKI